jgi:hypothetical protein
MLLLLLARLFLLPLLLHVAVVTLMAALLLVAGLVTMLVTVTGEVPQFVAVGTGLYAVISWAQSIKRRDKPTYEMIWGTPAITNTLPI